MITYKAIITSVNPNKTTVIFYDTKQDAENDAKIIIQQDCYKKSIKDIKIMEVNRKL